MATTLPAIAKALQSLDRNEIRAWFRRGELLDQAHRLCTDDGDFAAWLRTSRVPKRNAYRALSAWRLFGSVPTRHNFTREAMDLLGRDSQARAKAIILSEKNRITARDARELMKAQPDDGPPSLPAGKMTKFVLTGEGWKVNVALTEGGTHSDCISILTQALFQVKQQVRLAA